MMYIMNYFRKSVILIAGLIALMSSLGSVSYALDKEQDSILSNLKQIDPNIVRYFPRWRVCEPNLQLQIHQTFLVYGRSKDKLEMQNIVVTAAPKSSDPEDPYVILLVECGSESFVASEVDAYMSKLRNQIAEPKRPYCYREIPAEAAPSEKQFRIITDYLMPTDVSHSISLSAFEQSLKIGKTGFWLRNSIGTDAVGYHFWESGESRLTLQRPLYENTDPATSTPIPYLINTRLGIGYRMTTGGLQKGILSFIPERKLNSTAGKAIIGFDINAPFDPRIGLSFNADFPLSGPDSNNAVDKKEWAVIKTSLDQQSSLGQNVFVDNTQVLPVLRYSIQSGLFYHLWLDEKRPENYFRFDVGLNYTEISEWAYVRKVRFLKTDTTSPNFITNSAPGLRTYHPIEFGDWIYARVEYRSQSTFPFGVALQWANRMFLLRGYLPLVGEWLYLEAKYSTPMRTVSESNERPWEIKNFFIISPVLRLNIR